MARYLSDHCLCVRVSVHVCTHIHIHTSLPQHTARSVTASDQLSSPQSIIHAVCGLAGTLFISWLDPVLLSGSALQKE